MNFVDGGQQLQYGPSAAEQTARRHRTIFLSPIDGGMLRSLGMIASVWSMAAVAAM